MRFFIGFVLLQGIKGYRASRSVGLSDVVSGRKELSAGKEAIALLQDSVVRLQRRPSGSQVSCLAAIAAAIRRSRAASRLPCFGPRVVSPTMQRDELGLILRADAVWPFPGLVRELRDRIVRPYSAKPGSWLFAKSA